MAKHQGGMGFRNIHAFNLAMLAMQGWRLAQDNHYLLFGTLKARYFHNGQLLIKKYLRQQGSSREGM